MNQIAQHYWRTSVYNFPFCPFLSRHLIEVYKNTFFQAPEPNLSMLHAMEEQDGPRPPTPRVQEQCCKGVATRLVNIEPATSGSLPAALSPPGTAFFAPLPLCSRPGSSEGFCRFAVQPSFIFSPTERRRLEMQKFTSSLSLFTLSRRKERVFSSLSSAALPCRHFLPRYPEANCKAGAVKIKFRGPFECLFLHRFKLGSIVAHAHTCTQTYAHM